MTFTPADEAEVVALRAELAERVNDINSEISTANLWLWSLTPRGLAARDVLSELFTAPGLPHLGDAVRNIGSWPWVVLTPEQARTAAIGYLVNGVCMEITAFPDEAALAESFADRVLGWIGRPLHAFANHAHRPYGSGGFPVFCPPTYVDEGLVLIGPEHAGIMWFVGTD